MNYTRNLFRTSSPASTHPIEEDPAKQRSHYGDQNAVCVMTSHPTRSLGLAPTGRSWHAMAIADVAEALGVDPASGLTAGDAEQRLGEAGPNRLADPPRRSTLALFLDQFRNLLVLILLAAAVLAGVVGDLKDTVVITVVLMFNAVLGFSQEHRAERSLAALRAMLVPTARVRRDSAVRNVPAETLVSGDVVLFEAGDLVPADGRLFAAHALEIDESTLTGESTAVAKSVEAVSAGAGVADRRGTAFTNTTVTRGRGELLVHDTGPRTEVGKLAGLLAAAESGPTPLQRQLDALGRRLAVVAGVAVGLFTAVSLLRGERLEDLVLELVALAVAAIPEGLPAVVTVTLAAGTAQLAKRGAIVKRLASVETLGATSVICSDKTGTLTLNQMTARSLLARGRRFEVTGEGYEGGGLVRPTDGGTSADLEAALLPFVLCNDSAFVDRRLVGDPTEGALVTLAQKAGMDVAGERALALRLAEVPFDPTTKFMATIHAEGERRVVHLKGALEALLPRCSSVATPAGVEPLDDAAVGDLHRQMEALAGEGMRVLAAATGEMASGTDLIGELEPHLHRLTLVGLAGLADPPRPEAKDAIARCRRAGIKVVMITGDHAATASAIAEELDIQGEVLTGAELERLTDGELTERVEGLGVVARVAPEHKVRMVTALKALGHVVAMTGDGVNDAPALKTADIGVAMGITGTEVTKEAAAMVLTDDNFATIVQAVEGGRGIYANLVKFVRFQLSTNVGAILSMVLAPVLGLPVPFTALQLLWVNIIMDGPPAMALGLDPPARGTMDDPPRDPRVPILSGRRLFRVVLAGTVMTVGTLGMLAWQDSIGKEAHALAVAFTTFVLFQLFNALNVRSEEHSVFSAETLRNAKLWVALGLVLVLQVLAVHFGPVQSLFGTADLTLGDWALCTIVASSVLGVEELRKLINRRRPQGSAPPVLLSELQNGRRLAAGGRG